MVVFPCYCSRLESVVVPPVSSRISLRHHAHSSSVTVKNENVRGFRQKIHASFHTVSSDPEDGRVCNQTRGLAERLPPPFPEATRVVSNMVASETLKKKKTRWSPRVTLPLQMRRMGTPTEQTGWLLSPTPRRVQNPGAFFPPSRRRKTRNPCRLP